MENLKTVLEEAGTCLEKAVKVTVYLRDMKHFQEFNKIYATCKWLIFYVILTLILFPVDFVEEPPARTCIAVLDLPLGALVEVECIALE